MSQILAVFVILRVGQYLAERYLASINRRYYLNKAHRDEAQRTLDISDADMEKSLAYSESKYLFSYISGWVNITAFLLFLVMGGLGYFESLAIGFAGGYDASQIVVGLYMFGLVGVSMMLLGLPFSWYHTFVLEEKHGFNRQTLKGFIGDKIKGIVIGALLGGAVLALVLWIMEKAGPYWWVGAWFAVSGFSVLTAWLYPTLLAPLFNKFTPLEDGELKSQIHQLAEKVGFQTDGLFVMDASIRSSHGNAYFTGMFGKKRIVLFDTLIEAMNARQIVAVLAHELGHFKLHHVRWMLMRSVLMTGLTFYLLSLCLPLEEFYTAFKLGGSSSYGALIVFSLWFGLLDFVLGPLETYLSRRNEFAADKFALDHVDGGREDLSQALLKLREKSASMPVTHPLFSMFYYSHPPMMERLRAMQATP